MTRNEALAAGLKHYTSVPCKYGHASKRLVSNYNCVECVNTKRSSPERRAVRQAYYFSRADEIKPIERERKKVWNANNKVKQQHQQHKRRALKLGAEGEYTESDIQQLYYDQGGLCLCGITFSTRTWTVDHIIPLVKGGSNYPQNLQLLCRPCNDAKGVRTMDEWRATTAS